MEIKELIEKRIDQYNTILKIRFWAKVFLCLLLTAAIIKCLVR